MSKTIELDIPHDAAERERIRAADAEWKCCGCGKPSPKLERVCDCATGVLFRIVNGKIEHEVATAPPTDAGKQFRALCPDEYPLPWTEQRVPASNTIFIIAANNRAIFQIKNEDFSLATLIAATVMVAVNTCGGFRAELDNWGKPL
jgi:hypothetical protein